MSIEDERFNRQREYKRLKEQIIELEDHLSSQRFPKIEDERHHEDLEAHNFHERNRMYNT